MVGNLGHGDNGDSPVTVAEISQRLATVRSIGVGNKQSFREMNRFIETHQVTPILDPTRFHLEDLKTAFRYMVSCPPGAMRTRKANFYVCQAGRKHYGKIVIRVDSQSRV